MFGNFFIKGLLNYLYILTGCMHNREHATRLSIWAKVTAESHTCLHQKKSLALRNNHCNTLLADIWYYFLLQDTKNLLVSLNPWQEFMKYLWRRANNRMCNYHQTQEYTMAAIKPLLSFCQSPRERLSFPPTRLISPDLSGVMSQTRQSFSPFPDTF